MSTVAGRVMPLPKGLWDSETLYHTLDIVRSSDGAAWMAKRNNTNVDPVEGDDWMLLMAAPEGLVLTGTLLAGETELIFTNSEINNNSIIMASTDIYGVCPTEMVQSDTSVTLTFLPQSTNVVVKLSIKEG